MEVSKPEKDDWKPRAQDDISKLIAEIQLLGSNPMWDQAWFTQITDKMAALQSMLIASAAAFGECRKATPYKPLKPIIDAQGSFIWCCEHDPSHCAK